MLSETRDWWWIMYPEFAYSRGMQLILLVITFTESFFSMYMISNIILTVFGMSAERKQKMLFAFINGTLMWNIFVYGIYFLGGMVSFNPVVYHLIVSPSPINAIVFYLSAERIFKISSVRSIKLVSYVFIFWTAAKSLNRLTGSIFFMQNEVRYNYMKDGIQQLVHFFVLFLIFSVALRIIRLKQSGLKFVDNIFVNERKEIVFFLTESAVIFVLSSTMTILISERVMAYSINMLLMLMFIIIIVCGDIIEYNKQSIRNRDVHISALFKGMEELRGIKHDFNNILHTYSGYLELEEYGKLREYHDSLISATSHAGSIMELGQNMHENPAIVSLLINKIEYAEKMNVKMLLSLKCDLENFYVDNMDISRVLTCLLDNAIEAASESKQRKVHLTIESRSPGSKLVIVTNSTELPVDTDLVVIDGITTKSGHEGIGLSVIRSILGKYGNCSFQLKYFDYEFSTYIEFKETV